MKTTQQHERTNSETTADEAAAIVSRIEAYLGASGSTGSGTVAELPVRIALPNAVPELSREGTPLRAVSGGSSAWRGIGGTPGKVQLEELLVFDDEEFVRACYRRLLLREAEPEGLRGFVDAIRSGAAGKIEIIRRIRESEEGQRANVSVEGLSYGLRLERAARLAFKRHPGRGRAVLNWTLAATRLSRTQARVERIRLDQSSEDSRTAELADRVESLESQLTATLRALGEARTTAARLAEAATAAGSRIERLESRVSDLDSRAEATLRRTDFSSEQLARLDRASVDHRVRLSDQERRITVFLEEAAKRLPGPITDREARTITEESEKVHDALYVGFENRFRGTSEDIRSRLGVYLPRLDELKRLRQTPEAIDVGCGRGEWIQLLSDNGWTAKGVDSTASMVELCRGRGLDVIAGDGIAHLRGLPSESLDLVSAFHVVEHLPFASMIELFDEAMRILRPQGVLVLETPNPENVVVGACNFYIDPTHRKPIPATMLQYFVETRGFARSDVLYLHPASFVAPTTDPSLEALVQRFNGPQDYAVIGTKA